MVGVEQIAGLERMNINQCERLARDLGERPTFELVGPKGRKKCQWLDPYLGLFNIEGSAGFVMTKDFEMVPDVWCENLLPSSLD